MGIFNEHAASISDTASSGVQGPPVPMVLKVLKVLDSI